MNFSKSKRRNSLRRRNSRKVQFEALEARRLLAVAVWNNLGNPFNVDGDAGGFVSPLDALLVINELNTGASQDPPGRYPKQVDEPRTDNFFDVNCDNFASPIDALLVINHLNERDESPGSGTTGIYPTLACSPELVEGQDFATEYVHPITLPDDTSALQIFFRAPEFDLQSAQTIRDAFEIELTDEAGRQVTFPYAPGNDAVYNWSELLEPKFGPDAITNTNLGDVDSSVTVNLEGLEAGTRINVQARLVNNDQDDNSSVIIRGFEIVDSGTLPPRRNVQSATSSIVSLQTNLDSLEDLTGSFEASYGRTSLDGANDALGTELQVTNVGAEAVAGQLVVVLDNVSELEAAALHPDGMLPDGRPFWDLTDQLAGYTLAPGESLSTRRIGFKNTSNNRFDYRLAVYGNVNVAPSSFTTQPVTDIEAGGAYKYLAQAEDPEGQQLLYTKVGGPESLTIDSDSGEVVWATESTDVGSHLVTLRATDPHGLFVEQSFAITVHDSVPNRPPMFVTDPVTDAIASSGFEITTVGVGNSPAGVAVVEGLLGPRLVTANSADQTIGVYAGENKDRFDNATSYSTGFPQANGQLFDLGYSVEIGLPEFQNPGDRNGVRGLDQGDLNGDGIIDLVAFYHYEVVGASDRYRLHISAMLGNGDGGFSDPTEIYQHSIGAASYDYWNLTLRDFDADGDLDVLGLSRGRDPRLISILGNGDGTFAPATEQTFDDTISDFVVADVNEDGLPDLVGRTATLSFGANYTFVWHEGLGDGTFSDPNVIAPGGSQPNCCYRMPARPYDLADVNADGHLDLISIGTATSGGNFQIFTGDGAGNFALLSEPDSPAAELNRDMIIVADFNGDDLPDIVFQDGSNFHLLAAEDATGTSYTYSEDTVDVRSSSLNMAGSNDPVDIDGDGDLDFIFGEYFNRAALKVALNDGTGKFAITELSLVDFSGRVDPYEPTTYVAGGLVADYNRDGVMDISYFTSGGDFDGVGIRLGTRPGEFGQTRTIPWVENTRGENAHPGDFNGDGIVDLLDTANDRIFLGNGDGSFADPFPAVGVNRPSGFGAVADFNLDGLDDIVAGRAYQNGSRYYAALANGDGTFTVSDDQLIEGSFYGYSSYDVADFNNDGYPDFIAKDTTSRDIDVHLNDADNPGVFTRIFRYSLPAGSQGVNVSHWQESYDVGDYTGDGIVDLIFAERDQDGDNVIKLIVMAGDGSGNFVLHSEFAGFEESKQSGILGSRVEPGDFASGDLDEDGDLDLISSSTLGMRVFLNDGSGNFYFKELLDLTGVEQRGRDTWVVDFNEDGHLDIFNVGQHAGGPINVWLGDGAGEFAVAETIAAIASIPGIREPFVDLDGDGHVDFVYATGGNGNYNSEEAAIYAGRRDDLVGLVTADLNGDGNLDLLAVQEQMERLQLFVGDNLGRFVRQPDLQTGRAPKAVAATDLNDDGQLELLTVNRASRDISLFTGTLEGGFTATRVPVGIGPVDIAAADLDGDGNQDVVVLDERENALYVFIGDGSTTLAPPTPVALGDQAGKFTLGDATGDGVLDAVVTLTDSSRLMILPGDGTGGFSSPVYVDVASSPSDVSVLDLNEDGNPELAATIAETGVLSVHYGLGNNQFARAQEVQVGSNPTRVELADADEDGRLDLIVNNTGDNTVSVLYNRFDPNEVYRYDSDAIDPDDDALSYSIQDGPGGLIINSESGALLWAASPDQVGVHDVTIAADDGRGGVATQSFKIQVEPARENSAPIIASKPVEMIGANESFTYQVQALDNDNHPLRYELIEAPAGATINASTGEISWDGRSQAEEFSFDAGGVIRVPESPSLNPESITIEGWYNLTDLPRFNSLFQDRDIILTTHESDQSIRVDMSFPGRGRLVRFFAPIVPETDRWYHLALTYDASLGEAKLYIDGELGGSQTIEPLPLDTTHGVTTIGRQNGGSRANFDNFRIWNRARTQAEVREGMRRQYEGENDLVLDYRFEEVDATSVKDYSIYGNTGYRVAFNQQTQTAVGLSEPGAHSFEVSVEDGRGGYDEQSFTLNVVPEVRGQIVGHLFDDLNGNGVQDDGSDPEVPAEPSLADWHLFLDANGNGFPDPNEAEAVTDTDGNYRFAGLLPTTYPVRVSPVAGYQTPAGFDALVEPGIKRELDPSSVNEYDLAIEQLSLSQIRGQLRTEDGDSIAYWKAFADLNGDGFRGEDEPMAMSDRNGDYAIAGLAAGDYTIQTELPAGWADSAGRDGLNVSLIANEISIGNDFVLRPTNTSVTSGLHFVTTPTTDIEARQTLTYASVAMGVNDTEINYDLSLAPDGMVIDSVTGLMAWRPTIDQVGEHLVILRATDATGSIALHDFYVNVTAPNTAPVIVVPSREAIASQLSGESANDSERRDASRRFFRAYVGLSYSHDVVSQDAEGSELSYSLVQAPTGATIDSSSGRIHWTPAAGELGLQLISVQVTDSEGATDQVSWLVDVMDAAANVLPLEITYPRPTAAVSTEYFSRIAGRDALGRPLDWTLGAGPTGLSIATEGTIQWAPANSQLGAHLVELIATTADGEIETVPLNLEVLGRALNQTPVIDSEPTTSVALGRDFEYDVIVSDADQDIHAFTLLEAPVGMSVHPSLGYLHWSPGEDQLGEHDVRIQVSDPSGNTAEQSFTLKVSRFGGPPRITSIPPTTAAVGSGFLYSVEAVDREGDPLTYSFLAAPSGMTITENTGELAWTPTIDQVGEQDVVIQVSDGVGGATTQAFSVQVAAGAMNLPPQITSTAPRFGAVGTEYSYAIAAQDPENGAITYSLSRAPAEMSIDSNSGVVTWSPVAGDEGKHVVTLIATDEGGAVAVESFELDILAQNTLPAINGVPPIEATAGAFFDYNLLASDADLDQLKFELIAGPDGAEVDSFGRIRMQTVLGDLGPKTFSVVVTDARGGQATQDFTTQFIADTEPPKLSLIENLGEGSRNVLPWQGPFVVYVKSIDNVEVASLTLQANGQDIPLDASGTATFTFEDWTFSTIVATARAVDTSGNVTEKTITFDYDFPEGWGGAGTEDIPTAAISSPADTASVTGMVSIIGTADHEDLFGYKLSYRRVDETRFTEFHESTNAVTNGELGVWDTSLLLNDEYVIRLEVATNTGVVNVAEHHVGLAGALKLGNFQLSFTDMVIPVAGIPIEITRIYDTLQADRQGDFGYGWRLEYRNTDLRVGLPKSGLEDIGIYSALRPGVKVYLNVPRQGRQGFTFDPDIRVLPGWGGNNLVLARPRFRPDPGVTATLATGTSGYLQVNPQGELYAPGGIPYNPASPDFGGAYVLTTREGITYRIDGATGKLQTATDRNGNQVRFSEEAIEGSGGIRVAIARDAQNRISAITDPSGNSVAYDYSPAGDLTDVTDREGNTTTIVYHPSAAHYVERVEDPLNRPLARTEYDENGRLKSLVNLAGNSVRISYDLDQLLEVIEDAQGRQTLAVYDQFGNTVQTVDALGQQTSYSYDARNRVTSTTNNLGESVNYTYGAGSRPVTLSNAAGETTRRTYDAFDLPTSETNPLGQRTDFVRDGSGNLLGVSYANGVNVSFKVDTAGNTVEATDAAGVTTFYDYDAKGQLQKITLPNGRQESLSYDVNGNLRFQTTTVELDGEPELLSRETQYDRNGNPTVIIGADGATTGYTYTETGELESVVDATGRTIRYDRDSDAQPTSTWLNDLELANQSQEVLDDGVRQTTSLFNGAIQSTELDVLGRPRKIQSQQQGTDTTDPLHIEYDQAGRLKSVQRGNQELLRYGYDRAGRITETSEGGTPLQSSYDAAGRTSTERINGQLITYDYDAVGRVKSIADEAGNATTYEYGPNGDLTRERFNGEIQRTYEYYPSGLLEAAIDGNGDAYRYEYNELGWLTQITDPEGRETNFGYNARGQRVRTTRPDGTVIRTDLDASGRKDLYTNGAGETVDFNYDEQFGVLEEQILSVGSSSTVVLDAVGKRQSSTTGGITTSYEVDALGRTKSRSYDDGAFIRYQYDEQGNTKDVITPGGTRSFTYLPTGELETVRDTDGGLTVYGYDLQGRLSTTTLPNGVVVTLGYDSLSRVESQTSRNSAGEILEQFTYEFDEQNRITFEGTLDETERRYQYDPAGRLTQEYTRTVQGDLHVVDYRYDRVGNRVARIDSSGPDTAYKYDENDRLESETTGAVETTYRYDDDGRLVLKSTAGGEQIEYSWDALDQLIRVTKKDGTDTVIIEYRYDIDGVRTAVIVDGVEHRLLYDSVGQVPEVVEIYAADGTTISSSTIGYGVVHQTANGQAEYPVTDYRGSHRLVTNATAAISGSANYDAFGISTDGGIGVGLHRGFLGEFTDASGLVHLRARNLDTATGRFITTDPYSGDVALPLSLHDYAYAHNDPINLQDPTGLTTLAEQLTAFAIRNQGLIAGALSSAVAGVVLRKLTGTINWSGNTYTFGAFNFEIGLTPFASEVVDGIQGHVLDFTFAESFGASIQDYISERKQKKALAVQKRKNASTRQFGPNHGNTKALGRELDSLQAANPLNAVSSALGFSKGDTTVAAPGLFGLSGAGMAGFYLSASASATAEAGAQGKKYAGASIGGSYGTSIAIYGFSFGVAFSDSSVDVGVDVEGKGVNLDAGFSISVGVSIVFPDPRYISDAF